MFPDYYNVLGITFPSSSSEIKISYKKLAFKYHPDKNSSPDATSKMQEINEAYIILRDNEAKERYDNQYKKYQQNKSKKQYVHTNESAYKCNDDILNEWIINARKQARLFTKSIVDDSLGILGSAFHEVKVRLFPVLIVLLLLIIVFMVVIAGGR